uniref:Helicase n=1 Tax=viral metagenome TaxID=1070528 RepID=A0A6C0M0M6_9ZZZZ
MSQDDNAFSRWVGIQRKDYKDGLLSSEKIATLESIKGWMWNIGKSRSFDDIVEEIRAHYALKNGHPKDSSRDTDERKLAMWVRTYRMAYNSGRLAFYQIETLQSIEGWAWNATKLVTFEDYVEYARAHYTP